MTSFSPVFVTVSVTSTHCPATSVPESAAPAMAARTPGAVTVTVFDTAGPTTRNVPPRESVAHAVALNPSDPGSVVDQVQVRVVVAPPGSDETTAGPAAGPALAEPFSAGF